MTLQEIISGELEFTGGQLQIKKNGGQQRYAIRDIVIRSDDVLVISPAWCAERNTSNGNWTFREAPSSITIMVVNPLLIRSGPQKKFKKIGFLTNLHEKGLLLPSNHPDLIAPS